MSSNSIASAHPTSLGSVRKKRSSADQPFISASNRHHLYTRWQQERPAAYAGHRKGYVDRVAVGGQLNDEGIQRTAVEHDGHEDPPLPRGEFFIHGPAQRGDQVPPLGLPRGVEAEPVRQPLPVLRIERDARVAPEVPPDLGRDLEDDEL